MEGWWWGGGGGGVGGGGVLIGTTVSFHLDIMIDKYYVQYSF